MLVQPMSSNHSNMHDSSTKLNLDVAFDPRHIVHSCSHSWSVRSPQDVRTIAHEAAQLFPDPVRAELGINELLLNSVEHGNLEISHEYKTMLIRNSEYHAECMRRLDSPLYSEREASLYIAQYVQQGQRSTYALIRDAGAGFDFSPYMLAGSSALPPEHSLSGRGIWLARTMAFDNVVYVGNGNQVYVSMHGSDNIVG